MSKSSDTLHTLISLVLAFFMITVVLPIIAGTAGIMFAVNTITYGLLPKAELPRNHEGEFIVTLENYTNWHTMAKIESAKNNYADLLGQYVVRAFPTVSETCNNVKNCESYTSDFVVLNYENADVYLIAQKDDELFSHAVHTLSSRIQDHNKRLENDFDLDMSFAGTNELEKVSSQLTLLEIMSSFPNSEKRVETRHTDVVNYAKDHCRNNGIGCSVNTTLVYDYSVFGGPDFLLAR